MRRDRACGAGERQDAEWLICECTAFALWVSSGRGGYSRGTARTPLIASRSAAHRGESLTMVLAGAGPWTGVLRGLMFTCRL
jgi:hypothetical protein